MAEWTGLEPATPGVTGRYSNQLNYHSAVDYLSSLTSVHNTFVFTFKKSENKLEAWRCPTLTWGNPTLPSALLRFTSEFGMGSGGSITLWSPSKFFNSESYIVFLITFNSFLAILNPFKTPWVLYG